MTKVEATKRAKHALQYGHFKPNNAVPLIYQQCPLCNQKVEYNGYAWNSARKLEAGLRGVLVDHLREEH